MKLLEGKKTSEALLKKVKSDVDKLKEKGIIPKLSIIMVGKNPASLSYIRQKHKASKLTGIGSEQIDYDETITQEELLSKIDELNNDKSVHGILVQLPLPKNIYAPDVIRAIDPKKDVDGFTAYNIGKMFLSTEFEHLPPCTPKGVIRMLEYYEIDVKGMDATIVGASNIVGKPLSTMLLNRKATPTICHIDTKDLKKHTLNADLLCVAVGKANLITDDMVKEGAIVVDIGINRLDSGKLVGDVDFENVSKKASYITPVPGGVGPMTVACLMENTLTAAKRLNQLS